jgi:hypothetical protein
MKTYDLYLFASDREIILGWHSFDADGDERAVEVAAGLAQPGPLELWQDERLVKRWGRRASLRP